MYEKFVQQNGLCNRIQNVSEYRVSPHIVNEWKTE